MSSKWMVLLLIVSVVLGLGASAANMVYMRKQTQAVSILVATQELATGDKLELKKNVAFESFPKQFEGLATNLVTSGTWTLAEGKPVNVNVAQGEPIFFSYLDPQKDRRELAQKLKPGMRATSIPVSTNTSVANIIAPGDFVDIIGAFKVPPAAMEKAKARKARASQENTAPVEAPQTKEEWDAFVEKQKQEMAKDVPCADCGDDASGVPSDPAYTQTILQRVEILGVGQRFTETKYAAGQAKEQNYSIVTIGVTPEQAELIAYAQSIGGQLTLALRSRADDKIGPTERMTYDRFADLVSRYAEAGNAGAAPAVAPTEAPAPEAAPAEAPAAGVPAEAAPQKAEAPEEAPAKKQPSSGGSDLLP